MTDQQIRIPQQKRSMDKKNKIIDAGIELFSKKGFHNTNSTDIAKTAKVSIGTFYAYFKDKKEVFQEFMDRHYKDVLEKVFDYSAKIIPNVKDKKQFLKTIIERFYDVHFNVIQKEAEIMAMKQIDPEMKFCIESHEKNSIERTKMILYNFKDELKIKDIETASRLINITILQSIHYFIFSEKSTPKEKVLNELTDMIYKYLFAEG